MSTLTYELLIKAIEECPRVPAIRYSMFVPCAIFFKSKDGEIIAAVVNPNTGIDLKESSKEYFLSALDRWADLHGFTRPGGLLNEYHIERSETGL